MELDKFDLSNPKKFFEELVRKALEGKQSNFEFIRSYEMLKVARLYKSGTKKVTKLFNSLINDLINQYSSQIVDDKQLLETIMAIKQFEKCRDYYKQEVAIAKDMISEFKTYVMSGHILQTALGGVRPDFECVDYRKLPIKLF